MIPIDTQKDVEPFAGHAIAFFQTGNDGHFENCSCTGLDGLRFGLISKDRTLAGHAQCVDKFFQLYCFCRLHQRNYINLHDVVIKASLFTMRAAYPHEIAQFANRYNLKIRFFYGTGPIIDWKKLFGLAEKRIFNQFRFILGRMDEKSVVHYLPKEIVHHITRLSLENLSNLLGKTPTP